MENKKQIIRYIIFLAFLSGAMALLFFLKQSPDINWEFFGYFFVLPSLCSICVMLLFINTRFSAHWNDYLSKIAILYKVILIVLSIVLMFFQFCLLTSSYFSISSGSHVKEAVFFGMFNLVGLISNIYFLYGLTESKKPKWKDQTPSTSLLP